MFLNSWTGLGRVVIVSICAYAALVLVLRIAGQRSLAQLPASEMVVRHVGRPLKDPLMTLQWLHVRAKPDPCREIRPPAHRPPWDDAGAEA